MVRFVAILKEPEVLRLGVLLCSHGRHTISGHLPEEADAADHHPADVL